MGGLDLDSVANTGTTPASAATMRHDVLGREVCCSARSKAVHLLRSHCRRTRMIDFMIQIVDIAVDIIYMKTFTRKVCNFYIRQYCCGKRPSWSFCPPIFLKSVQTMLEI